MKMLIVHDQLTSFAFKNNSAVIINFPQEGLSTILKKYSNSIILNYELKTVVRNLLLIKFKVYWRQSLKSYNKPKNFDSRKKNNHDSDYSIAEPEMIEELLNQIYHKESIN
ncbi:MAG: hypothetical protein M5R37_11795 [Melioribacteraceae bacterium]|nr:hypothetical protein [Melioribacteraceae bacterium]